MQNYPFCLTGQTSNLVEPECTKMPNFTAENNSFEKWCDHENLDTKAIQINLNGSKLNYQTV